MQNLKPIGTIFSLYSASYTQDRVNNYGYSKFNETHFKNTFKVIDHVKSYNGKMAEVLEEIDREIY